MRRTCSAVWVGTWTIVARTRRIDTACTWCGARIGRLLLTRGITWVAVVASLLLLILVGAGIACGSSLLLLLRVASWCCCTAA